MDHAIQVLNDAIKGLQKIDIDTPDNPDNPDEPDVPSNPDKPNIPQTGDSTNPFALLVLITISGVTLLVMAACKKNVLKIR